MSSAVFMKLFTMNNKDIVRQCQPFFNFELPSMTVTKSATKFYGLFRVGIGLPNTNLLRY